MTATSSRIRVGSWAGHDPAIWRFADDAGLDHLWTDDHPVAHKAPNEPAFETWTLLAGVAMATKHVYVGSLITAAFSRHPSTVAKQIVTVDHLSGGRVEVGLGVGWNEATHAALGLPFQGAKGRMDRFDEFCQVLKLLWTEPRANFNGKHFKLTDAVAEPKPIQKPHPRIWIGGSGPKRTLLTTARYADGWNTNGYSYDEDMRALETLRRHCSDIRRDPKEIRLSLGLSWTPATADADLRVIERYVKAGFADFIVYLGAPVHFPRLPTDQALKAMDVFVREGLPKIRQLG